VNVAGTGVARSQPPCYDTILTTATANNESKKMKAKKSNTEAVKHLMEYSRSGALFQMFLIQALKRYGDDVLASESKDWTNGMISYEAWRRCAQEAVDFYAERTDGVR